jgi:hypothetical protein
VRPPAVPTAPASTPAATSTLDSPTQDICTGSLAETLSESSEPVTPTFERRAVYVCLRVSGWPPSITARLALADRVKQVRWPRGARAQLLVAVFVYTALDLGYFGLHVLPRLGSTCACRAGADPFTYMWFLSWWPHALLHGINPFVTSVLFAPGHTNLGAVDELPGVALLASPITLVSGPLVAYNVLALAAPLLSAVFAFLLCRYISASALGGLAGGYIFGFSPYMLGHLQGHLDLMMIFLIPAGVHLTLRLIEGRIGRRPYIALMALTIGFLLLSQAELALTFVLVGAVALGVAVILVPAQRTQITGCVAPLITAGAIAAVVTSPFIYYALTGPTSSGFFIGYSQTYVADSLGFVIPTPVVRLGRNWFAVISATFSGGLPENGVYVGALLVLVIGRYVATSWSRPITRLLLVLLAVVVVLMLGPHMHVAGQPTIPLPWGVLDQAPLLSKVAPVRLAPYLYLMVAMIVALWLGRAGTVRSQLVRWAVAALGLAALVPNLSSGLWRAPVNNPPFFTSSGYRSIVRAGSVVLPLPFAMWGSSMLWQAETGFYFRMADGYVGALLPFGYGRDLGTLSSPAVAPQPAVLGRFLAQRHVSTVLVSAAAAGPWPAALSGLGLRPRLVQGVLVYSIRPR